MMVRFLKRDIKKLSLMAEEVKKRGLQRKLFSMYPDEGEFARHKYVKHLKFFSGKTRERLFSAANRTGKTTSGAYEAALHLTGLYPEWWDGTVFDHPVTAWGAGVSNESTRGVVQKELFGIVSGSRNGRKWVSGTGMIPYNLIEDLTWKQGVSDMIDTAHIRNASGGISTLELKAYKQGRRAFEGQAVHFIWFDEEPPREIYSEAITRTATTQGIIYTTFTPLLGVSETVKRFLEDGKAREYNDGVKAVTMMSWAETPHLDDKTIQELTASYSPHEIDARTKGIPSLGSGVVYPVPESHYVVEPFKIPKHFKRVYGMDVGWNYTAVVWGAIDPETEIVYIYDDYKGEKGEPHNHAHAIKRRGKWIHGVIDPAARSRGQKDGEQLLTAYRDLGLSLIPAKNAVSSGLLMTYQLLSRGQLKVFKTCNSLLSEMRLYRRDEKGNIVKEDDHCVDGLRYLVVSGLDVATSSPEHNTNENAYYSNVYKTAEFDVHSLL
jgi:phage terminase large subunit-like protein